MGAVLVQPETQDGIGDHRKPKRPIAYFSRAFNSTEAKYTSPETEMMALVAGLEFQRSVLWFLQREQQIKFYRDQLRVGYFSPTVKYRMKI